MSAKKIIKSLLIGSVSIVLVTVGIDASDHYDNLSESLVGRLIFPNTQGPCPSGMVLVNNENSGFCIDIYEASPSDNCVNTRINSQTQTKENIDDINCQPESVSNKVPWRFISQSQAMQACAKAGKRLPTEEEWYLASLGTPDKDSGWDNTDCQVAGNWTEQPGLTGSGMRCESSVGAYDMIGNVWEWVKGEVRDGNYNDYELPGEGFVISADSQGMPIDTDIESGDMNYNNDYLYIKPTGVRGIARGGYWDNKDEAGMYSVYLVAPPSFAGTGIGFRCAK